MKPEIVRWSISSAGVTDHNGQDLPDSIPHKLYVEPRLDPKHQDRIGIERSIEKLDTAIFIEPHSIITLELEANP
jgi:hypothetical protein